MLHEQFKHQTVANSIDNERFLLKNAANTVEMDPPPKKKQNGEKKPNNSARPRNGKKYATKLMGQTIIFMGTWRM